MKNKKIIVALSGGVDSATAAYLLKEKGYDVSAGFIVGYNVDGCQDVDLNDAKNVSAYLKIPFYVFDMEKEYKRRVVDYMIDGYRKGITPNPDVVCNSRIKFGLFYDKAMNMGFDAVASGHYAINKIKRISNNPTSSYFYKKEPKIFEGADENKDQSYFLWDVEHEKFWNIIFPLGRLKKREVRKIAKREKIPVADKKDSQGVCFLGKFDFADFLKSNIPVKEGEIIDTDGNIVGYHDGVWFYTIGQRHGFRNTAGVPYYVIAKDIEKNKLIVAYENSDKLYSDRVAISDINFLDTPTKDKFYKSERIEVMTRIRYRQKLSKSYLIKKNGRAEIVFAKRDKLFPAPGQSAVFYNKKGQMLGGGVIL